MRPERESFRQFPGWRPESAMAGLPPWLRFAIMSLVLGLVAWFSGGPMLLVYLALGRKVEMPEFAQHAAQKVAWAYPFQQACLWAMATLSVLAVLCCIWEGMRLRRLADRSSQYLGVALIWLSIAVLLIGTLAVPPRMVDEPRRFRPVYSSMTSGFVVSAAAEWLREK